MSLTKNKIYSFKQAQLVMRTLIQSLDARHKPETYRIELKVKPIDLISWLEAQDSPIKIYGANQDNQAAIAGIGKAVSLQAKRVSDLAVVFKRLRERLSPQYPYLQWYGGFCFDDKYLTPEWADFSAYRFVLPRFELARDGDKMIFCCNLIGPLSEISRKAILHELDTLRLKPLSSKASFQSPHRKDIPSKKRWDESAKHVIKSIPHSFQKIVLARRTILAFPTKPNSFDIFRQLYKVTPKSYHFYFQFNDTIFLGASPERLYQRHGRRVLSEAVAGTSSRGKDAKEDRHLKQRLIKSIKDNHEHGFVVKAIKENLGGLCTRLDHSEKPLVISLNNGHHLITPFEGELQEGIKDEDILHRLHPTPAVAGTPRTKVISAIRSLERFSRGWYAGPLGYVGLDWAEFVVGIRSGMIQGRKLSLYAGAGIVKASDPEEEWLEIENKISNFIKIIN